MVSDQERQGPCGRVPIISHGHAHGSVVLVVTRPPITGAQGLGGCHAIRVRFSDHERQVRRFWSVVSHGLRDQERQGSAGCHARECVCGLLWSPFVGAQGLGGWVRGLPRLPIGCTRAGHVSSGSGWWSPWSMGKQCRKHFSGDEKCMWHALGRASESGGIDMHDCPKAFCQP